MKMRTMMILFAGICILQACGSRQQKIRTVMTDTASGLLQQQDIRGFQLSMQYLPQKDTSEWCFRVKVRAEDKRALGNNPAMSYGVDTLFRMVAGNDTLMPVHAMRIANGNINGLEYMVIFEKQPVHTYTASLVFLDGLFTQRKVVFPVNLQAIEKIEAIN